MKLLTSIDYIETIRCILWNTMLAMGNEHYLPQQPLVGELFLRMFEES